jgi:hypothetical protein
VTCDADCFDVLVPDVETDLRERLHDLLPSSEVVTRLQPLSKKNAHRIQRLCGRLDWSDECGKSMWHARPHIKPGIDTGGNGTLDVSS